jgi:hypothetical protein
MMSPGNMRRQLAAVAMLAVLVLSMGCTSEPRVKPGPKNPAGSPVMDAAEAVSRAKDYMYRMYAGSDVVHAFTVTRKVLGTPCAWNGSGAGNATSWMMYIEGIMGQSGTYRYIEFAVNIHFTGNEVFATHAQVDIRVLPISEINATSTGIDLLSLEPYLNIDSHALFVRADAARLAPGDNYYLQSINMSLNHNTTSRYAPNIAAWEVAYKYAEKNDYSFAVSTVVLEASTWTIIKVVPPG